MVVAPTLLVIAKESLWPAVLGYHALCLALPLVYRHGFTEAGFTVSNARRWLPLAGAVSIAVLAAGEVGRHMTVVTLLPSGWDLREQILSLDAQPGRPSPYGQKYETLGPLTGPNGKNAWVRTIWIVLTGETAPRLVTLIPAEKP
jgi:hypothetical protein